ncbi:glucoamylase [Agrobacterium sp. RC10-4-1]|uniref:glucan 1,4-alpha-glucosidase n=1 Tax=Agrobacterium sp. RC10-4-1 TaxID=2587039 RepID=UPI0015FA5C07|nr:glucan 1,4-alpha-glucosidase [Agrobacterium sp. RC10-4-1]MBA8801670.1 glucoamylase [Agrobacterium sp. RC10-4-1]MDP9773203.1 glucoamylase [Rhizobium sp. SORGH_AS_0755]
MRAALDFAPGAPGIDARWTSSAKTGVGTALSKTSPVWFTLSHGILNEVYYPRIDSACTRDLGLVVTRDDGYFSEEKRDCISITRPFESGIPAFHITNTATDGSYRIEKQVITDPARACVLQQVSFSPLKGKMGDYRVSLLLAPHLVNAGNLNSAWIGEYEGRQILFATGRSRYLALICDLPWRAASAGFVGVSDGWQQLHSFGRIIEEYQRADDGNVSLAAEIDFSEAHDTTTLALGFGQTEYEAAACAVASLKSGFRRAHDAYIANWRSWQDSLRPLDRDTHHGVNSYRVSTTVLAAHRAADRPGAVVASLSIPWGASKGDDDLGGYHLIWPRDLVEAAGGFLAAGDHEEALAILDYLRQVQQPSGRWPQNLWLDGKPYWPGVQMDQCAFPILLADMLHRHGHLDHAARADYMPMIRSASAYILANGPTTGEDRWEEDAGYSPFTLAVEIAALLAAADLLDMEGDAAQATHLRQTADCWNEQIERWTFAGDPTLCSELDISGHYIRIASPGTTDAVQPSGTTPILNQTPDRAFLPTSDVISPDALALVRFGLRAPDDPHIVATVKAIDHCLRADLPQGPVWYRYTGDGYGEHADGTAFDGTGQGRPWPLLTGERAHYELAAGRRGTAEALLTTMEKSAGQSGLFPEQVWDQPDLPDRELFYGHPSGSAMPLVWAHAEHIKLLRSLADGSVFDMPPQGVERYIRNKTPSHLRIWCFNNKISAMPAGKVLRLELADDAIVHWSTDGWATTTDTSTMASGLGTHFADLPVQNMGAGGTIVFTFYWRDAGVWENENFTVRLGE